MRPQDLSWPNQHGGSSRIPEGPSTNIQTYSKAVKVDGEVLKLRCWACGTEHCVDVEQCAPEELALIICSKNDCRMSLFLINELAVDEQAIGRIGRRERSTLFAALWRLWK
jgi:hypothetical protein